VFESVPLQCRVVGVWGRACHPIAVPVVAIVDAVPLLLPMSTPRAVARGAGRGAVVVVVVLSLCRLLLALSFPSQLLPIPPHEQLLTAAVGDAVVVPRRPCHPFVVVVPLLHSPFPPREQVLTMVGSAVVVVAIVVVLPWPSFSVLPLSSALPRVLTSQVMFSIPHCPLSCLSLWVGWAWLGWL
jgi:hypothetical protein